MKPLRFVRSALAVALMFFNATSRAGENAFPLPALPQIPAAEFRVTDYGAVADDEGDDTEAFIRAMKEVNKTGGGRLIVPVGLYRTGPLTLGSKMEMHLVKGARILFLTDPEAYRIADRSFRPLISARGAEDLGITGEGILDGQGEAWWGAAREYKDAARARGDSNEEIGRPRLIIFEKCKRVLVDGVTLQNSPQFHFIPSRCEDVTVRNVKVKAPDEAPNTDGIDPAASKRVHIIGCIIDTGDDNIAIKSGDPEFGPAQDILVEKCTFRHGHGMSIGSETNGGVRNLLVRNCTFEGTEAGVRMKSSRGKGGLAENLTYENLTMRGVGTPIEISSYYPRRTAPKPGKVVAALETRDPQTPVWRDINISNLKALGCTKSGGLIIGLPEEPVYNITMNNVSIDAPTGLRIAAARGVTLESVSVEVARGEPLLIEADVRDLHRVP